MLEIIIIFIVIITAFGGAIWYAIRSTRQRKENSLVAQTIRTEPELNDTNTFSAVLAQEMTQHIIDTDVESEPNISLSAQAKEVINNPEEISQQQSEIDFKVNDDIDINTPLIEEPDPKIKIINDWNMVITFTIMAVKDHKFSGKDIKFALESQQLQYGDLQLFHRLTTQKKTLFSVANILDPGVFDLQNINTLSTPGILIFAKLPGPINGLSLFDELLETSRSLSVKLSGVLCDDSRQPITDEALETMRNRILSLNFSMHSASQNNHVYTD